MPSHQSTYRAAAVARYDAATVGSDAAAYHGDCEQPTVVELRGVGPLLMKRLREVKTDPFVDWYIDHEDKPRFVPRRAIVETKPDVLTGYAKVRCRKCAKCLAYKRRLWTARAISEVRQAQRTWFVTLTVGPERRIWATAVAQKSVATRRCEDFYALSQVERTRAIASAIGPEVTRWLKRVRKEAGVPLRYLLVTEPHGDGFPHFHLLIHEPGQPVRKRTLEGQWRWGFSKCVLIPQGDVRATGYVCKYLTKSAQTRVRASRQYGELRNEVMQRITEAAKTLTRATRGSSEATGPSPTERISEGRTGKVKGTRNGE